MIRVGEEGLALLGDDTESVEAALMNETIAIAYGQLGNPEKWQEITRDAPLLQRLPYCEELRWPYANVAMTMSGDEKNLEETRKWLDLLEQKGREHHDLKAVAEACHQRADLILAPCGD